MFPTGYLATPGKVGSGEIHGGGHVIIGSTSFQEGLIIGRFAFNKAGVISNLDNTATPVLAGVVQRLASYPMDMGSTLGAAYATNISCVTQGVVSVDAVTGQSPVKGDFVYAVNAAASGANFGKATTTSTNNALTNAKFVEKIADDVWLVQLV